MKNVSAYATLFSGKTWAAGVSLETFILKRREFQAFFELDSLKDFSGVDSHHVSCRRLILLRLLARSIIQKRYCAPG